MADLDDAGLATFHALTEFESRSMTQNDDPDHARLRRFVNASFLAANVAKLRDQVESLVHELLDDIDARGLSEFDLVGEFAYQLPFRVVCHLLGVEDFDTAISARGTPRSARASARCRRTSTRRTTRW